MNDKLIEQYEFKSPSYELKDRSYPISEDFRANSRYTFDDQAGIYRSKAENKDEVQLLISGDLLCQEIMIAKHRTADSFDFTPCFEYVRPLFRTADFAAGNLETPIAHTAPYRGEIITHEGPYYCNAPVKYLEGLNYAGFDMLYTANNHTLDAGARGLMETIENCRKFGFIQTGTNDSEGDKFVIVDICGFKVGFASFAKIYNDMDANLTEEGKEVLLNTYTKEHARLIHDEMVARGAEFTIALPHWGLEYTDEITSTQEKSAIRFAQYGYDLVVGAHAHVIQRADEINGTPILYSMGNLLTHLNIKKDLREQSALTVLYSLKLKRTEGTIIPEIGVIPCKILRNHENIPFTVVPLADMELPAKLRAELTRATVKIEKRIDFDNLPIITDYKVSKKEAEDFKTALKNIPEKLSTLLPYTTPEHEKNPVVLSQVTDRSGIYLVYSDHAEISHLLPPESGSPLVPPNEIEGKPVTILGGYSTGNKNLRLMYLPKKLEVIGPGVFKDYSSLESVRCFSGLKTISMGAFENCTSMTGIILPETLECIDDSAFKGCTKLMSVKLPYSIKHISDTAFDGCDKLTLYCVRGSYGDQYAQAHNIPVKYKDISLAAALPRYSEPLYGEVGPTGVKMGVMNSPEGKHPLTILITCQILGVPLPENAVCGNQPSKYIPEDKFPGTLKNITRLLGDLMPNMDPEELTKKFRQFKNKYRSQKNLDFNNNDLTVYFCDWLLFARDRGFNYNCYFDYELYNKEWDIRDTFLNEDFRTRVSKACRVRSYRHYLINKGHFNAKFKDNIKRPWIDASTCSFDEFKAFAGKHDRFFGKPIEGTGGAGARVITTEPDNLEAQFAMCKEEGLILEEIIKQHPTLAEFSPNTLNTVRVTTLFCADGKARVVLAVARFGRHGKDVDNFHEGGVGAVVDIDTGLVITEAINIFHECSPYHPDSHKKILGFQYPEWDKVVKAVCSAAETFPEVRNIGWDVAVTAEGNIEFVEGNSRPNYDVLQSPDQLGRRFRYFPYLAELEQMKGISYKEYPALPLPTHDELAADPDVNVAEITARLIPEMMQKQANSAARKTGNGKKKSGTFAGPAMVIENEEELNEIRKTLPPVKTGPKNQPTDKHPKPILEICEFLGHPLPEIAVCGHQPSYYIGKRLYRGTIDSIEKLLGKRKPEMEQEEWQTLFRQFRFKYQNMECLDRNPVDFTVYFLDFLLNARPMGFNHDDYFDFEFYNKEPEIRTTFADDRFRLHIYHVCVPKDYRDLFKHKPSFDKKFAELVNRDFLDVTACSLEEFKQFTDKHSRFFVKPLGRTGGTGAYIAETGSEALEELFAKLQAEGVIAEEIVVQHEAFAVYNASSLNTVRVHTIIDADNVPHVVCGMIRFGRKGKNVDNFHQGGVCAILDIETGTIITEAMNRAHFTSPIHPDSKLPILGEKCPFWDELKATALKAAMVCPEVRHVGWDLAVNQDGKVVIIEGNSRPGFDIFQSPDQIGRRHIYEKYMVGIDQVHYAKKAAAKAAKAEAKAREQRKLSNRVKKLIKKAKKKIKSLI